MQNRAVRVSKIITGVSLLAAFASSEAWASSQICENVLGGAPTVLKVQTVDDAFQAVSDEREFTLLKADFHATNEIYFAVDSNGDKIAVFKRDEITKLSSRLFNDWDLFKFKREIERQGLMKRSVAASTVSSLFGLDFVPVTVEATSSNAQKGTLQAFLAGYKTGQEADATWIAKISRAQIQQMYLYDTLLGMADRHNRNWMVNENGELKLIDTDHILYKTSKIRWRSRSSRFAIAQGSVEDSVAKKFLAVTPEQLELVLRQQAIPEKAIALASARLKGIQDSIRKGDRIEKIRHDYTILAVLNYPATGAAFVVGAGAVAILHHVLPAVH